MKLGWLVWKYADDDKPELWDHEPSFGYHKILQIVYAEVVQ